jgi:hypothetical protein
MPYSTLIFVDNVERIIHAGDVLKVNRAIYKALVFAQSGVNWPHEFVFPTGHRKQLYVEGVLSFDGGAEFAPVKK